MPISNKINTSCPVCEETRTEKRFKVPGYSIYYCGGCGIEFNADFPPKDSVKQSFSKEYYTELQKEAFSMSSQDHRSDPSHEAYKRGLHQIEELTDGRKVLDVGAGLGSFLKTASDNGWEVSGVEISPFGSDFIMKKYGFRVYSENLTSLNLDSGTYDAVTFWDVIEHVDLPKKQIEKAAALLKPGGVLLLTSDNYRSLMSSIARLAYRISFGRFTYPMERLFIPYNKTYFNYDSMRKILKECGFEIVYFKKMQYPIVKLKLNPLEKIVLHILYGLEHILNMESQFTFIARKADNI